MRALLRALVLAIAAVYSAGAGALFDGEADWDSVRIKTAVEQKPMTVSATKSNKGLESLTFVLDGARAAVPKKDFVDLGIPRLQSLEVRFPDVYGHGLPNMYIALEFQKGRDTDRVHFYFAGTKYFGRQMQPRRP